MRLRNPIFQPISDPLTDAYVTVELPHNLIHDGEMFGSVGPLAIGAGATLGMAIYIPEGCNVHVLYAFLTDAPLRIRIYDDPTNITNFAQVFIPNRNRNSGMTMPPGMEFWVLSAFPGPGSLFYDITLNPGQWFNMLRLEDELIFGHEDGSARTHVVTFNAPGAAVAGNIATTLYCNDV